MDYSGVRNNSSTSISQNHGFSFCDSYSNIDSNDNKHEELNWGLFNYFNNAIESPKQLLDSTSFPCNINIMSPPGSYYGLEYFKEEETNVSDFIFQSQTRLASTSSTSGIKMEESTKSEVLVECRSKEIDFSREIGKIEPEPVPPQNHDNFYPIQANKEQGRFRDGYNWRKYGQKQVKGSKKPRSYYKCSNPNCPMKKKVEKDLNGYVTEIIYKGKHNHPMPQNTKKSSLATFQDTLLDYPVKTNHSVASFGQDECDQDSSFGKSGNECEYEPKAKKCKIDEAENEAISSLGRKTIQEPRVVIETKSEIDVLEDGYKWRKYGQKVVKGNPNPRSYYKCTNIGCPVRKLVERASHDLHAVITTYESKHNHGVPITRGGIIYAKNRPSTSNTTMTSNNNIQMEGMTNNVDYGQSSHSMERFENSKDNVFMEISYPNLDWKNGEYFLSTTTKEAENEFVFDSYLD